METLEATLGALKLPPGVKDRERLALIEARLTGMEKGGASAPSLQPILDALQGLSLRLDALEAGSANASFQGAPASPEGLQDAVRKVLESESRPGGLLYRDPTNSGRKQR